MQMRVVWKDTITKGFSTKYTHRGYALTKLRTGTGGWITDLPGDKYIYSSPDTAMNAIDEMLGGVCTKRIPKRHRLGIKILGERDGSEQ